MSLGFLIQDKIFEDDQITLIKILQDNNIPYIIHKEKDFWLYVFPIYNYDNRFSIQGRQEIDKVFCYGSLEWIFQIQKINNPNYKTICTIDNYDCKNYYHHYKNLLFNKDAKIWPVEYFLDDWDGEQIFIRPCVGYKPKGFTGGVYKEQDRNYIKECFSKSKDILIAPVKHIDYEYRFIVNDKNKYITGCQYKSFCHETKKLGFDPSPIVPLEIQERFIDNILSKLEWHPDPIYVIDVAESDAELFILEINALSTSGWYDCDYGKIVKEIIKYYGI